MDLGTGKTRSFLNMIIGVRDSSTFNNDYVLWISEIVSNIDFDLAVRYFNTV